MTVRQAIAADAGAICAILNPMIRNSTITFTTRERDPDEVAADIRARGPAFLVAESAGVVRGFASFGPFRAGPGYVRTAEHSIHLASGARGQGMGRALIAALQQAAIAQGIHVLVAAISGGNAAAIAFHDAVGFVRVGHMPQVGFKAGELLDLVLMQKILRPRPDGAPDTAAQPG